MPTRFYLPASTAATAISPTPDAAWESTAFLGRAVTRTSKIGDTLADVVIDDANNADQDIILRQYVSRILTTGQTVTGAQALKAQCRVSETGTGNNMFFAVGARIIASDGTTVRKTVLTVTRDGVEAATTLTNRQFTATSAATNYTTLAGDRLVIEIGMAGDPTGSNPHDSTMRLGDSGASDLAENDTATTDDNPWFELNDTLTFVQPILDLDPGSYSISGTAADLLRGEQLPCDAGSYTISGTEVILGSGKTLDCSSEAYAISGTETELLRGLQLACDAGSYVISGTECKVARHLVFDPEAELPPHINIYTVNGGEIPLQTGRVVPLDVGVYTISGTDVSLESDQPASLDCDSGVYSISGTDVSLEATRARVTQISVEILRDQDPTAHYARSTQIFVEVLRTVGYGITCDVGAYSISGSSADLPHDVQIVCDAGIYSIAGASADLVRDAQNACDPGSYAISGTSAELQYSGSAATISADPGVYTVSGTSADLQVGRVLAADSGEYLLSGTEIGLTISRTLAADSGIYSISGVEPTVSAGKLLDCSGGQYDVDGTATGLTVSRSLQADSTTYLITGTAADLSSSVESRLRFIRGWIAKKRRV